MSEETADVTFSEIQHLMQELPGPDLEAETGLRARLSEAHFSSQNYGQITDYLAWLARWQGEAFPDITRPRIALFAANHGLFLEEGMTDIYPRDVTKKLRDLTEARAPLYHLSSKIDADLRLYEMDLSTPTHSFLQQPAMTEDACAKAMAYGMMAVEQNVQLLALGEIGSGSEISAAALCLALFGGKAEDWLAPTGTESRYKKQLIAISEAVEKHRPAAEDLNPFQVLATFGGFQFAAICGAIIAARLARIPVVLDGFTCLSAAAVLTFFDKSFLDHCVIASITEGTAQERLMKQLDKQETVTTLSLKQGDGVSLAFAVEFLKSLLSCLEHPTETVAAE